MSAYDSIERFAAEQGWVVKYAADGTPNFFYPIPKCKSSDLDASLPEHTHPAFIINGQEIDRRLIAVYKGSLVGSAIASIPNAAVRHSEGADGLLSKIKAAGTGFGPKTVADSGLLLLLAKKMGWSTVKGNNNYGTDYRDATKWAAGASISLNDKRAYKGMLYEAQKAHTSAAENAPDIAPLIWKPIKRIGGVMSNSNHTLTGSGPVSWRFGGKANGIDDLTGNVYDQDYGYRIYDNEIQILENNNAADPSADLGASSAAWKAILPSPTDGTYTLVAPGTAGTLKWNWANSKITLDTVAAPTDQSIGQKSTAFASLAVNSTNVPHIPYIMFELGLFPISGDTTQGTVYHNFDGGERFPRRGGSYNDTSNAGLAFVDSYNGRGYANVPYGVRSGFVE